MANSKPDQLDVRSIRFSRDVIDERFENKKKISNVLTDLQTGILDIRDLPKITVVKKDGLYFSLDNRRLWVLKQYAQFLEENEDKILHIPVKHEPAHKSGTTWFTTTSEGESVKIQHERSHEVYTNIETVRLSEVLYSDEFICTEYEKKKLDKQIDSIKDTSDLPVLKVVRRHGHLYAVNNTELWMIKKWYETNFVKDGEKHDRGHENDQVAICEEAGAAGSINVSEECITIEVELRPYNELPENITTLDRGKNIQIRDRQTKCKHPKFKALTRQEVSQEKRVLRKYCRAYEKQPTGTFKFFKK